MDGSGAMPLGDPQDTGRFRLEASEGTSAGRYEVLLMREHGAG